jgi:DNA repair protein RadC
MADLSKLDAFQLADIEMLMMLPYDENGRLMPEKALIVSQGPLCMAAIEPADVLVPALQASARAISLWHFRPQGDIEPMEEHHLRFLRFYLELMQHGRPLGIRVLDYQLMGDPYARRTPFFSCRKRAFGEPALSYRTNW